MKYNWQQEKWPEFEFDRSEIEKLEKEFLIRSGHLGGLWQCLNSENKEHIKISILADEALKTSEIEGEIFNRDSVRSSIQKHFGLKTNRRVEPGEYGVAKMMVDTFQSYDAKLSEEKLFYWHTLICNGRDDLGVVGGYRKHEEAMQIVSGQIDRPKVHFEAPPSKNVPKEMQNFVKWIQEDSSGILVKSAIAHLYFTSIHPFEDGNGRVGRAISEYTISHSLGKPSFIMLSTQVEEQKKQYYDMLEIYSKTLKISGWILWFGRVILDAQEYSIKLFEHILAKSVLFGKIGGDINNRQEKVLLRMFDAGVEGFAGGLSAKNYATISKAPPATTTRDLADLVKKGVLTRTGERKTTRYFLNI
ncbi:Fic family protein [Candidatus Gracilibacteria bacterium]|nr:Fic family protein [Candidatus Gracilibacteria bacterium]